MEKFDNRKANSVGSSRIRGRWLLPYWSEAEEFIIGKQYDVIIFQKVYWEEMMKEFTGIKILDLCDPDWLEGRDVFRFIDLADAVVTSTAVLADFILRMRPNKKVVVIPDRIDLKEHSTRQPHDGVAEKVVWFGYYNSVRYLEKTFDHLIERGLELTIISDKFYEPSLMYQTLKLKNLSYEYPRIHNDINKADIVLLPEPTDERGRFKSNNKILTAWALGMPVARTPEDLDKFETAAERNKEAALRRKEIERDYDVKFSVEDYRKLIDSLRGV